MDDPDPDVPQPLPPAPRDEGAATGGKDLLALLATLEPIDEDFPDVDAGQEPLRDVDLPDDQDCGGGPGRR
ncbi:hypothetical protein [Methylobacterium sp. Gmos1]